MKAIDLAGSRYGTLTVLSRVEPRPVRQSFRWLCKCDCGTVNGLHYLCSPSIRSYLLIIPPAELASASGKIARSGSQG